MPWQRGLQLASRRCTTLPAAHLATRPSVLALGWGASTRHALPSPLLSVVLLPQKRYKNTSNQRKGKRKTEIKPYRTYPSLHLYVVKALDKTLDPAPKFNHIGTKTHYSEFIKDHKTMTEGRFQCRNPACSVSAWHSENIALQIRAFPDNTYDAVVFKQFCRKCDHLAGSIKIDEDSYIDKVADRLKKWAGVIPDTPEDDDNEVEEGRGPPHESSLCEGGKGEAEMKSNLKTVDEPPSGST